MQVTIKKIVVLGTGGTIAGRAAQAADNVGYRAGEVGVAQLLEGLPQAVGISTVVEQVAQVDSKDMGQQVWQRLLARVAHWTAQEEVAGVLITHGTDTLEETAWMLQLGLSGSGLLRKPVVLTCAMRPASALVPDGPQNLLDAFALLRDLATRTSMQPPAPLHVMAVCAGVVHAAVDIQKVHPYRLDPFTSADSGPLGYVEEGRVRWVRDKAFNWQSRHIPWSEFAIDSIVNFQTWPQVSIVMSHAGADASLIDLLLASKASGGVNLQGLVIAATGNGTVHEAMEAAAMRALAQGVQVVRATRCSQGPIVAHTGDSLPDAEGLSPVKARIALQFKLLHAAAKRN